MNFKKNLQSLRFALDSAIKQQVDLSVHIDEAKAFADYKLRQRKYAQERVETILKQFMDSCIELRENKKLDPISRSMVVQILDLVTDLNQVKKVDEFNHILKKIESLALEINLPVESTFVKIPKKLPPEVKGDLEMDLNEIQRCYDNGCFRSCVILCGRVLETALHRKYYEATGNDVLEKNPGIGLGNLIAKMAEKNINLDPGLTNQIHLINQVRVFSVHKKKDAFYPSQQQTQAMILYTLDVLEKLFGK
jgi:hypothetical protein